MTTLEYPARKQSDWITPVALRSLIKTNLGYNARQVTVSTGCSRKWLTITIRDPKVDVMRVQNFANDFDTMECHQDDSYTGQSVSVTTTSEVDDAHGLPFVGEIQAKVAELKLLGHGCGLDLSNGSMLWLNQQGYWVERADRRASHCWQWDAENDTGAGWALKKLAKDMARV